jgi:hypothetical protein
VLRGDCVVYAGADAGKIQVGKSETRALFGATIDAPHATTQPTTHEAIARVLNGSIACEDGNDPQDGSVHICYVCKATEAQVQSQRTKDMTRMQWYHSLGWILVGVFIVFFGVGMVVGIDERQPLIPILVILSLATGVILVNKY